MFLFNFSTILLMRFHGITFSVKHRLIENIKGPVVMVILFSILSII